MADELSKKTSFGYVELDDLSSDPTDADSSRGAIAMVNGNLKVYDGSDWQSTGKWVSGDLSDGSSGGGMFSWQNPEDSEIIVDRVIVDITSAASDTSDSTMQVGTAADDSTASDNLIDDASTQGTGQHDNVTEPGTNGTSVQKMDENGGTTDYITGSEDTADVSDVEGKYYIHYMTV